MSKQEEYRGTGRRKRAIIRAILRPGKGEITVNGKSAEEYFLGRKLWIERLVEPLQRTNNNEKFDVILRACGGGVSAQADAARLAIARALLLLDGSNREILRPLGMLTRDPREVERKHYYKRKARKSPQYSKR